MAVSVYKHSAPNGAGNKLVDTAFVRGQIIMAVQNNTVGNPIAVDCV